MYFSTVFGSWCGHAKDQQAARHSAAVEQAAAAFHRTGLLVRGFQAWEAYVEDMSQER